LKENIVNVEILICDKQGTPRAWADEQTGACYYARDKVVWALGSEVKSFIGGRDKDGETSRIDVFSILGVEGPIFGKEFYERESVYAERTILYGRDRHMCAYCGDILHPKQLTIDHVMPRSRKGKNTWMNTVSACKPCNVAKGNKTPEEARMHLLYVPYVPNVFEKMILKNRHILADQMEFLIGRVPKHSRLLKN
jgi:hypothetical protein